jgi:ArsR family transcriptional regulator
MKQHAPTAHHIDLKFRAFSDRTRLRILALLQGGECCVGDLVEVLGLVQPSASRHLAYLKRAGLVKARKAGQWSYYSLAEARGPFHGKLLECLTCCFGEAPELRDDQARARRLKKAGGCCPRTPQCEPKGKKSSAGCCPAGKGR